MQIKDIVHFLESWAPISYQESYDNSGLLIGDKNEYTNGAIITLDVTEHVLDEAIAHGMNMVIAHHPLIFSGIKRIGPSHWQDKCIRKAIKHDLNIYAIHTNLDNIDTGVNKKIADKIGLINCEILSPKLNTLLKLTVFVPYESKSLLLDSLYNAGAGEIGNYTHCSFQLSGEGTFRPNNDANPVIGKRQKDEIVSETRIEVILPQHKKGEVLNAMKQSHPYEEVAYYLSSLINENQEIGSGMIGSLPEKISSYDFLSSLKSRMELGMIRHTQLVKNTISKVAVCGGSGSFLLKKAINKGADIFITADFKYHDFFEANKQIIIADIGHYESEVYTKDLITEKLTEKFPKFAFRLSEIDTNPINYL